MLTVNWKYCIIVSIIWTCIGNVDASPFPEKKSRWKNLQKPIVLLRRMLLQLTRFWCHYLDPTGIPVLIKLDENINANVLSIKKVLCNHDDAPSHKFSLVESRFELLKYPPILPIWHWEILIFFQKFWRRSISRQTKGL